MNDEKVNIQDVQARIEQERALAVVRANTVGTVAAMADALLAGGISIIEITMNSPGVLDALRQLRDEYGDRMLIGAGTVLEPAQVEQVAELGVKFIVSPDTNPDVIRATLDAGLISVPGALTPTEIRQAVRAGAHYVKLFPGLLGGAAYLKMIRGPLDDVKFVVTGGVDTGNARQFLDAGAVAVGLSSALVSSDFDGSPEAAAELTRRAAELRQAIESPS